MELILERLFHVFGDTNSQKHCPKEEQRINSRRRNLSGQLQREQYRQIQRLLDDCDIITCKMSILNFAKGVHFGIWLMMEIFKEDGCDAIDF